MAEMRICRNVKVSGRRTSLSLEPYFWQSLEEVCRREGLKINTLCTLIDKRRGNATLTAVLRVFLLRYFRAAADFADDGATDKTARLISEIERSLERPSGLVVACRF